MRITNLAIATRSIEWISDRFARLQRATDDAAELDAIAEELVALANTRHNGRPLFGGDVAGDAVTGSGVTFTYSGDAGRVERGIGETEAVQVNISAQDAFWFTPSAGFADNVFALLGQVSATVANGDAATVAAGLDAIDAAMDQIGRQLALVRARTNRVEAASMRAQQLSAALVTERSELADVDLAEAIVRLRTEETAYQTALAATARSLPPGLAMFLS